MCTGAIFLHFVQLLVASDDFQIVTVFVGTTLAGTFKIYS